MMPHPNLFATCWQIWGVAFSLCKRTQQGAWFLNLCILKNSVRARLFYFCHFCGFWNDFTYRLAHLCYFFSSYLSFFVRVPDILFCFLRFWCLFDVKIHFFASWKSRLKRSWFFWKMSKKRSVCENTLDINQ